MGRNPADKEVAMAVPQRVLDIMQSGDVYLCDDEEMLDAQRAQQMCIRDRARGADGRRAAGPAARASAG